MHHEDFPRVNFLLGRVFGALARHLYSTVSITRSAMPPLAYLDAFPSERYAQGTFDLYQPRNWGLLGEEQPMSAVPSDSGLQRASPNLRPLLTGRRRSMRREFQQYGGSDTVIPTSAVTEPGEAMGSNPEAPARPPRIAAFIDYENVKKHLERNGEAVSVERIQEQLRAFGELLFIDAFLDATRTKPAIVHMLRDKGVRIIHSPKRRGRGADPRGHRRHRAW